MKRLHKLFLIVLPIVIFHFNSFSQERKGSNEEMPILAWVGVPEEETTIERFRELKESGININFSWYSSVEAVEKALDIAQKTGVKLLPSCPELKSEPEKTAKRLMKHPALSGYHLVDEPNASDFDELANWVKRIQSVDKKHYCYINLFPNYASAEQLFEKGFAIPQGEDIYAKHVDTFLKIVPVPFISFDHYPLKEKNGIKTLNAQWYKNLEVIAAASKKYNLPFWAFALTVPHNQHPVPSVAEIKLQLYSNLAYGAQVLQYFTYWTPGINASWDFYHAPIGLDGKRTDVYDRIKLINREVQNIAKVFLDAKVISVSHTGNQIPSGTRRIAKLPAPVKVLETGENGAIISLLEKGNQQYLIIVNRDFESPMKLTIATDESVKKILKDGTSVPANTYTNTSQVDPGDMVIYSWEK